jgi:5-methylcytosine-specific restriction endonuclease McrA
MERRIPLTRTTGLARVVPLRPVSNRRQRENRQRRAIADRRWPGGEQPGCWRPGCGRLADDLHEILPRARGGSITDEANTVPLCRADNEELTLEPAWGYELGLLRHSWDGPPEEVALTCAA